MAYALQLENTEPPIYIGVIGGFIEKVASENQALQFNRIGDASAMQELLIDSTTPVTVT